MPFIPFITADRPHTPRERGITLIESLVSLFLFAIGILALIGMYATAVGGTADAQYRAEASAAAHQLINAIAGSVQRNLEGDADSNDLKRFAHNQVGPNCDFQQGSTMTPDPMVGQWLQRLKAGTGLPGSAKAEYQQVRIESAPGQFNRVIIAICWDQPGETTPRRHQVIGYVN